MADWMKEPPKKNELAQSMSWANDPPSKDELGASGGFLEGVAAVGKTVDSYTGAPVRKAIGEVQEGRWQDAPAEYWNQLGQDPATAPTGKDIAKKSGVSDVRRRRVMSAEQQMQFDKQNAPGEYARRMKSEGYKDINEDRLSAADVVGFGVEMVADPLNALPGVGVAKRLLKGADAATDTAKGAGVLERAGQGAKKFAEKTAVNATGATGVQSAKFSDDAGRQLLDRRVVRFGDSQSKIAERASEEVMKANAKIDGALKKLEAAGVKVDANKIYAKVRARIQEMKTDASQADIAKMLENELDNVINAADAAGTTEQSILAAEKTKRGYNRKAGNWMEPEKGQTGKTMYQTYREEVEGAARAADPQTAALFEEGKKSYGLMDPIREAAERRAATTSQSPPMGFLDMTTAAGGAMVNPVGTVAAPIARRIISPRISSSVAVTADKAGDALLRVSKMKAPPLSSASKATVGANALSRIGDKASAMPNAAEQDPAPKGRDKWAADGFAKISDSDKELGAMRDAIMQDPKGMELLVQASDLKPGSKAFERVTSELRERFAKGKS